MAYAYRAMVEAEHAWAKQFGQVYELSPPRDHYGEDLASRRCVVLARGSEIPPMDDMLRARSAFASFLQVLDDDGKPRASGPGSRGLSPVMRFEPGAEGARPAVGGDGDDRQDPAQGRV